MSAPQFTLRTTLFRPHEARYWEARKRAFGEIEWFDAALAEADDTFEDWEYGGISADDLEARHGAAEAAEWLLENPNATTILRAQERLGLVEQWAAWRPVVEQEAIDLYRCENTGEGA